METEMETETKPDVNLSKLSSTNGRINVKVQAQDGGTVHFVVKRTTPMMKLMTAYCDRKGIQMNSIRFVFDGNPITPENTPDQLAMEEDDCIEVYQSQTGGKV
ncbi:small ubiquitin-related modifier 3-like [Corticium candelabrum]|uniref:small ubiquitin-related modifier 3-like n=1 Tax=Corticium candelabrum TaxID=121492 RepID=UPI002E277376|nr:small ubiquitin-related modifier 3-like [Corticium candelabrum]